MPKLLIVEKRVITRPESGDAAVKYLYPKNQVLESNKNTFSMRNVLGAAFYLRSVHFNTLAINSVIFISDRPHKK